VLVSLVNRCTMYYVTVAVGQVYFKLCVVDEYVSFLDPVELSGP